MSAYNPEIMLIIHQIRPDRPFYLKKKVSYQEEAPVPFQHPSVTAPHSINPRKTDIRHILNEVGQEICFQVFSEVKTASTSIVDSFIISKDVG